MNQSSALALSDTPAIVPVADATELPPRKTPEKRTSEWWLEQADHFARDYLQCPAFNFHENFIMPDKGLVPVFAPGHTNLESAIRMAVSSQKLPVYLGIPARELPDVPEIAVTRLYFIEDSLGPNFDTIGQPLIGRGQTNILLGTVAYVIAYGFYYFATKQLLDIDTRTAFPTDELPGWKMPVASTDRGELFISWDSPRKTHPATGVRRVFPALPKSGKLGS